MRILFAGTPEIAVPSLRALVAASHRVEVLTNPDAAVGRGGKVVVSAVKAAALDLGLTIYQPERLDAAVREQLEGRFDLLVSFAYGKIFGPLFLALFPQGGVNIHPSLLPRWRGPSPLSAAIAAQDSETGITVQRLALGMDEGDILCQCRIPLEGTETTGTLTSWAAGAATELVVTTVRKIAQGTVSAVPQSPDGVTYCRLLSKDDGVIHWARSAREIDAQIRSMDPWPGTSSTWEGQRILLKGSRVSKSSLSGHPVGTVVLVDKSEGILVQTGNGIVAIRELQLPARKSLDFRSFLNGNPRFLGAHLGDQS